MRQRKIIPGVDPKLLIKDAARMMPDASRRSFLSGAASLGALTFLTGCDIIDGDTAESVLRKISEFNDGAQAAIFNQNTVIGRHFLRRISRQRVFQTFDSALVARCVQPRTVRENRVGRNTNDVSADVFEVLVTITESRQLRRANKREV